MLATKTQRTVDNSLSDLAGKNTTLCRRCAFVYVYARGMLYAMCVCVCSCALHCVVGWRTQSSCMQWRDWKDCVYPCTCDVYVWNCVVSCVRPFVRSSAADVIWLRHYVSTLRYPFAIHIDMHVILCAVCSFMLALWTHPDDVHRNCIVYRLAACVRAMRTHACVHVCATHTGAGTLCAHCTHAWNVMYDVAAATEEPVTNFHCSIQK